MAKIAVFCAYGNVRSAGVAEILKDCGNERDVLVGGTVTTSESTRQMVSAWADRILVVEEGLKQHIPAQFHHKVIVLDIGPDIWGIARHPDLIQRAMRELRKHSLLNGCNEAWFMQRIDDQIRKIKAL